MKPLFTKPHVSTKLAELGLMVLGAVLATGIGVASCKGLWKNAFLPPFIIFVVWAIGTAVVISAAASLDFYKNCPLQRKIPKDELEKVVTCLEKRFIFGAGVLCGIMIPLAQTFRSILLHYVNIR